MWVLPLAAGVVASAFAVALGVSYGRRRTPHNLIWAAAMLLFAIGSFCVLLGLVGDWSAGLFKAYWLSGAVLTVPFLAQGEIHLLFRSRWVRNISLLALLLGVAFASSRLRSAHVDVDALGGDLPSGSRAFGPDPFALTLARLYSYPAFVVLVGGAVWSAFRMRARSELRDRFWGTVLIALGATIVAAGSAFAATGNAVGFSVTLASGIAVMFVGFRRASRPPSPSAA